MISSSQLTQFIVIRHGETDWNRQARMQGHADVPLNAEGQAQAAQLARALVGQAMDAIYTSDLQRAGQTAAAIAAAQAKVGKNVAVHTTEALRERHYGAFQGKTLAEIEPLDPQAAARWRARDAGYAPTGGELLDDFAGRIVTAFVQLAEQHPGQVVVVVSHGGVLDVLWRMVHGLPMDTPRSWPLPNTGINRLGYAAGLWQVHSWGDVAHLQHGNAVRDETIA